MADGYLQFSETFPVNGRQAVWLQNVWSTAEGKGDAQLKRMFGDRPANLCELHINPVKSHSGGIALEAQFKCEKTICDLHNLARVLQWFLRETAVLSSPQLLIRFAEFHAEHQVFGGGIVLVTAKKYVVMDTDDLVATARKEVERVQSDAG